MGSLIWATQSLYKRSESLVRIACSQSDSFPVRVGLHQGCPSVHDVYGQNFWFGGVRISSLLFADEVVLLASSNRDFQLSLERLAAECESAGMRTSESETMVLRWKRVECHLQVESEVLPQVEELKYLGVLFISEGTVKQEIDWQICATSAVMWAFYRSVVVKR